MCWNKGAPRPKHKKWGDRVGAPARLPVELGVIGAVDWFAGFWRRNMPQESVLLLASTLSEFWSPIRNIYSHTNSLAALPSSAPFSRWIHNKSAFQHSPHHICLLEGSSWKKKKIIFCWYLNPPPLSPRPPPLPLSCLLPEGEKNISTQRQHCNLFFPISHGAQIEIELDRDIRSARCDNCKRILFKNTLTFVHPVSNI